MSDEDAVTLSYNDALRLAEAVLVAHGASSDHAGCAARSLITAEAEGNRAVGLSHLLTYCDSLDKGRVDGTAEPDIKRHSATLFSVDAREGFPFLGVDLAWRDFVTGARQSGVALLSLRNGYTCGALGYFVRRLAEDHGLAGIAATNAGPAVMPASGGKKPVFCTNPLAFAVPGGDGEAAVVIDQSSAASAIVGIRAAAERGEKIPEGWALDKSGNPTTDPNAALEGTLLPFGGVRGANIALMVEMLAAGLTGANWSRDAPAFNAGTQSPGIGLLIIAIDPRASGGANTEARLISFLKTIQSEEPVHIPGAAKAAMAEASLRDGLRVKRDLYEKILALK